jgi:citrate lyase beta subunit
MILTSLDSAVIANIVAQLSIVDRPAEVTGRQPVHTCYVPADKLTADVSREWGDQALAALDAHGALLDVPADILVKVRAKLEREPIEDLRIDFEDGYGTGSNEAEDTHAQQAATMVADWLRAGTAPPWYGIRFKSFDTTALLERGVRTLDVFLTTLIHHIYDKREAPIGRQHEANVYDKRGLGDGAGIPGLTLTFPKVTAPGQVAALADLLELMEERLGLPTGVLRFEIQIETTESIVDRAGRIAIPGLIAAGRGRVSGLHFGTYDYTAACGLDAAQQHLAHRACDFARHVMQVSAAGTGVRLCDGSTNVLPVGDAVERGWRTHYDLVRRSLEHGFRQGWDLHPAQLVTRYAAVYAYYLENAGESARRLGAYLSGTAGSIADEPATARALAATLRRAVDCGALTEPEVTELVGTPEWSAVR